MYENDKLRRERTDKKESYKVIKRQTERHTYIQKDRQTGRQRDDHMNEEDAETDREMYTYRWRDKEPLKRRKRQIT